ncbi:hypothetical protein SNEBB_009926, partial [Seison nebaliae]
MNLEDTFMANIQVEADVTNEILWRKDLPYLNININEQSVYALIDTGAQLSFISNRIIGSNEVENFPIVARTAQGELLSCRGRINLKWKLMDQKNIFSNYFVVSTDLTHDCIIGNDIIRNNPKMNTILPSLSNINTTGFSPSCLIFNKPPNLPSAIIASIPVFGKDQETAKFQRIRIMFEKATNQQHKGHWYRNDRNERKERNYGELRIGDHVRKHCRTIESGISAKLQPRYSNEWTIREVFDNGNCRIQATYNPQLFEVHHGSELVKMSKVGEQRA